MKKTKLLLLAAITAFTFNSCTDENESTNNEFITFEATTSSLGVNLDSEATLDINIYAGNVSSSERTIGVVVVDSSTDLDPSAYTVPTTVSIPAGTNAGILSINIKDIGLDFTANRTLTLALEATPDIFVSENIAISIKRECPNEKTALAIAFDGYASESGVTITDSSNNVVFSAGGWADGLGSYNSEICLVPGNYTFTITDAYSDGLSYPANGTVNLTYNGRVLFTVTGDFGASATGNFTI